MDEEQQLVQDDAQAADEWDQAAQDFASDNDYDLGSTNEHEEDESGAGDVDSEQNVEDDKGEEGAGEDPDDVQPEGTEPVSPDDDGGEDGAREEPPKQEYPTTPRDARALQRELREDEQAIKEDIRKEVFGDVPQEILDADGDPIRTISDVQRLYNPNTGQPFTEEEAAIWLMQAQRDLDTRLQETDKQVEEIADTNLTLKDESDAVMNKYGELLKSMPELQQQVWAQYEKTLIKDPNTGIIQKAPVSLEEFYNTQLSPYVKLAQQLEEKAKFEEQQRQTLEEERARLAKEAERKQQRSDRQDIYSGGKSETESAEDKEWAAAAKELYEG